MIGVFASKNSCRFSQFHCRDGLGPGTGVVDMDVDDDDGMWNRMIEKENAEVVR